jgi:signal transduction histidine kinase
VAGRFWRWLGIGWLDVALALGLSVLAILEGSGSDSADFSPAVLLCTAPLIVRRRWPIPVLGLALAGFFIAGNASNLAALAGGLIAALSVGLDARHPILGGIAALAAAAAIAAEFGRGSLTQLPIPGFLTPFLLIGSAFLAGRTIAGQRTQIAQLRRDQEAAVTEAAEEERRRIARELHDVIAHSVGVMVVQAGAARHVLAEKPQAAEESLRAVEDSGHEAMAELRRMLGVLAGDGAEPPLAPQPGIEKLESLVARVREAGLPVSLRIEGTSQRLPPGIGVAAYRIVQEALTNALKYAGGAPTEAVVRIADDAVDIDVIDEGKTAAPSDGIGRGLTGMRERVALFGGTIEAGRRDAGGYAVHAHLPVQSSV